MKQRFNRFAVAACLSLGALAAAGVSAQSAGSVMLRLGAIKISPDVTSGDLSAPSFAGTQVDLRSNTQLGGGLTYMLTDQISIDVPLSLPFRLDIVGAGAISGVGKIGEVRVLPFTVLAQYRFFDSMTPFRPYLGAGLTYARFYKGRGTAVLSGITGGTPGNPTSLSVASKLAATVQLGASYSFTPRWFIDVEVSRTFLKTRATLTTGQTLDATLNPNSLGLSVGYRF